MHCPPSNDCWCPVVWSARGTASTRHSAAARSPIPPEALARVRAEGIERIASAGETCATAPPGRPPRAPPPPEDPRARAQPHPRTRLGRGRAPLPGPGQGGVRRRARDLQRVPRDHEELQEPGDRHAGRHRARVDALRGLRQAHLRLQHVPARGLQDRRARRVAGPAPRRDRRAAQEHAAAGPAGRGEEGHGQAQAQGPAEEGGAGARRRRRAPAGRIPGSRFNT